MSDPSTSTTPLQHPSIHPDQQHNLHLIHNITTTTTTAHQQQPPPHPPSSTREYRKGNWTIQETLILITAKKLDDERRLKNPSTSTTPSSSSQDPNRPTNTACLTGIASPSSSSTSRNSGELRWKWVENYCWSHGCLRSQNQCNDKWDNLLRDYKKVRDYESKSESSPKDHFPSYWILNKQQRKEQNLPSNMVFEIYQAISEVLQRKQTQRIITTPQQQHQQQQQGLVTLVSSSSLPALPLQVQPQLLPPPPQPQPQPLPPPLPLQQPPPPPHAPASSTTPAVSERTESSDSEKSEEDEDDDGGGSESKRRKVKNLGSSIMRSASVLARALRRCEEKKDRRHRELIEIEQKRIQMEEARNEVHRQGIATIVAAVSNLSGAIHSFINSEHHGRR